MTTAAPAEEGTTVSVTRRTEEVSTADLSYILAKVEKANRKAARAGVKGYEVEISEVKTKTKHNHLGTKISTDYVEVTLVGEAPRVADWEFVATLDWDPDAGLVTRVVPGLEVEPDLSTLRTEGTSAWCDHCNTARFRHDTFAIRNVHTGEIRQVGRNCLAAFLGIQVALWIPSVDDTRDEDGGGWFGRAEWSEPTEYVLAEALAAESFYGGFVSRAQVRAHAEAAGQGGY